MGEAVNQPSSATFGERSFEFDLEHKKFVVVITPEQALELYVDECLRKRRDPGERDTLYVWTNIELHWEEHRYVEARLYRATGRLKVTVNGDCVLDADLLEADET